MVEQAPAEAWVPVTDYSFAYRVSVEAPHADRLVETFRPDLVLDYGCGFGHLVRLLRERGIGKTVGYDPQRPAYAFAAYEDRTFDLVICREVLEHVELRHVLGVVDDLCRLSSKYVYLTTRFHPHPSHLLDVATSDSLDPTHITLLNQDFLRALFVLHGFKRDQAKEQAMDWQSKGRVLVYERV